MVVLGNKIIKNSGKYLVCLILFISMIHLVSSNKYIKDNKGLAYASSSKSSSTESDTDIDRVYDKAGLLSSDEIEKLEALSREEGEASGLEIIILTHNDKKSTYPEKYIEDFEDQLPIGDRVYFLYDVYRGEIFMEGYGLAETYIHSKRIDTIFDNVEDDLRDGKYYRAFKTYITLSAAYMEDDSELNFDPFDVDKVLEHLTNYMEDDSELNFDHDYIYDKPQDDFDPNNEYSYDEYDYDQYYSKEELRNRDGSKKDNILLNFWVQLLISLLIGGLVVGVLAYQSGGKMTASGKDYLDSNSPGLIGKSDIYIRSTVTKRRRPTESSSSGGSGRSRGGYSSGGFRGGRSSGGRSHSSGGRRL